MYYCVLPHPSHFSYHLPLIYSSSLQTNRLTEKNMLAYPFEDSRSFPCLNTEPNKNSSHFLHFSPVLWICITLMRIGIRLVNLLRIPILILFDVDPDFCLMWIRLFTLMRIRILASKYRLKPLKKRSNRFVFHKFYLVICKLMRIWIFI
jgi:hypothetical protein